MSSNSKVIAAIYRAIDDVNDQLLEEEQLEKLPDTILIGSSELDSLGLVNFVVAAEQEIEEEFGVTLDLAADLDISQGSGTFSSIQTLADAVTIMIENAQNE